MVTRVLIMAGGTGGHVFPALAVADVLRSQGVEVSWIGTQSGLESRVVTKAGIPIEWVTVTGLRGKGAGAWLWAPFRLFKAVAQALRIMWHYKPTVVLGMGGFVAGPGGLAAKLLRVPLVIHEQNAIAGLTNRLLAPFATKVLEGFAGTFQTKHNVTTVGNPVRMAITQLPPPQQRFATRQGPLKLLIVGGSLGAQVLNEVVPQALMIFTPQARPAIWHQTGSRMAEETAAVYRDKGIVARVEPFIEDMAAAYGWADLVICRAGALTVAELAAAGVAAVLIPFPYAVDDHQTHNAMFLMAHGAATLLPQRELTAARLYKLLNECGCATQERSHVFKMANAARELSSPHAATEVARLCLEAAHV